MIRPSSANSVKPLENRKFELTVGHCMYGVMREAK